MIDSDFFFHQISIADGLMRNQIIIDNIYKSIDIYDLLLSYDIEYNKTFLNTILSKLIDFFKNCDNQTRFMINNLILKYQSKFNEIFIKGDIVNSIIQVLTCNDSTSRFYAIQLTKHLPFLFEQRVDLIFTLIDLLIHKSSNVEKKEILELIQRMDKKFNYNKIFLKEIVENFEEIFNGFENENNIKLSFLKLIENSLKIFDINQCLKLYQSFINIISYKIRIESNLLLTISTLILYKIAKIHNFVNQFLDEIFLKILFLKEFFHVFLSTIYFLDLKNNHMQEFLQKNKDKIYEETINVLECSRMSKYSFLGLLNFVIFLSKTHTEEYENLLVILKENISLKLESKYIIKLIHDNDLKDPNVIFKLLDILNLNKSSLTSLVEVYQLNNIINSSFDKDCFLMFSIRIIDFTKTNSTLYLTYLKTLKKELIINNDKLEKLLIEKGDPLLQLHFFYLGGNSNYNKIKLLYENTGDIIQKYKLLKVSMSYKDFKNLNTYVDEFIYCLSQILDKPLINFYKDYFLLLNRSLSSISKSTNYFTKKVNMDVFNEEFTSIFFKLKLLKYSQNYFTEINDFSKEFISSPAGIIKILYKILSIAISSKIEVKVLLNLIDLLLNSSSIFLLNKEKIIQNLISMKLFFLRFGVDETTIDENTRMKIFNEIHFLISKIIKYYIVFHELISFKYEIKNDFQKEIIEKEKESFNIFVLLSFKGLGYYDINSIQMNINIKNENDLLVKKKDIEMILKDKEKNSFTKTFSIRLCKNEKKNNLIIEIEFFFIYRESLKFKFISFVKHLFN